MLKQIFISMLKPHFSGIFFIISAVMLIFIYWQLHSYSERAKKKVPLPVLVLSGLTIFTGAESLLFCFASNEGIKNLVYVFLLKVIMFFVGATAICLGIFLLKLNKWSRSLILWLVAVSGLIDVLITITGADYTSLAVEVGVYFVIFTVYYLGLDKKYFKKDDEGFTLHPDAAIKKKDRTIFDWLGDTDDRR